MTRKFTGDTLVLATHNAHKIMEMRAFFDGRVRKLLTAKDLNLPEPPETGTTFLENAMIKAFAAAKICKFPVLAEDSGLCVVALGGAPGVYTADWAGHPRNFRAAMQRILHELDAGSSAQPEGLVGLQGPSGRARGPGSVDRHAYFQTTLVLAWPDGHAEVTEGQVHGTITLTLRGAYKFGYDPIFMPDGYAKTFGEMLADEKIAISHRTRAVQAMLKKCF